MFFEWNGDDFCLLSLLSSKEKSSSDEENRAKSKSDF